MPRLNHFLLICLFCGGLLTPSIIASQNNNKLDCRQLLDKISKSIEPEQVSSEFAEFAQTKHNQRTELKSEDLSETFKAQSELDKWPQIKMQLLKTQWRVKVQHRQISMKTLAGEDYKAKYWVYLPQSFALSTTKEIKEETILLAHGLSLSSYYFHDLIRLLTSRGYRVVVYDGLNSGHTLKNQLKLSGAPLKLPTLIDDALLVKEIFEVENLSSVHLVSHSRGFAVSTMLSSHKDLAPKIVGQSAFNPYIEWLADFYIDSLLKGYRPNEIAENFPIPKGMIPFFNLYSQLTTYQDQFIRKAINIDGERTFLQKMVMRIKDIRLWNESFEFISDEDLIEANLQNYRGTFGLNHIPGYETNNYGQRGHEAISPYIKSTEKELGLSENKINLPWKVYGFQKVPTRLQKMTHLYYSINDALTTKDVVKRMEKANPLVGIHQFKGLHNSPIFQPTYLYQQIISDIEN